MKEFLRRHLHIERRELPMSTCINTDVIQVGELYAYLFGVRVPESVVHWICGL